VSVEIWDIDGTITTTGNTPNEAVAAYLRKDKAEGTTIEIVSARPDSRLEETKKWFADNDIPFDGMHLNDFAGAGRGPNVGIAFKESKYKLLIDQYGLEEIDYVVDNDADVRAMAQALGLEAMTAEQVLAEDATHDDEAAPAEADTMNGNSQQEENSMAREHETRALPLGDFTVVEGEDGQKTFTGYAAVFGAESQGLPFIERIANGAFSRAIKQAAQGRRVIKFLHGHDESRMLATTASGRLTLTEDAVGLKVEARLDPADPDAAAVISKLTNESKAMGMSFGFTVPKNGQQWNEDGSRTLTEIGLLEVSTLSGHTPAYPATLGLTAVRKIAPNKIGVDGDALVETLEAVKAGNTLDADQTALLDAVRAKLGAAPEPVIEATAPAGEHHTIVAARLKLEQLKG
jgi:HK97 family phage prohead protease